MPTQGDTVVTFDQGSYMSHCHKTYQTTTFCT